MLDKDCGIWTHTRRPTQSELQAFVSENRTTLRTLKIESPVHFITWRMARSDPTGPLDFTTIGKLPSLTTLSLTNVKMNDIIFNTANTPALQKLTLNLPPNDGARETSFRLQLPQLRTLAMRGIRIESSGDVGLSLSRCPKLEDITARDLHICWSEAFVTLPSCVSLYMCDCMGLERLDILYAPKLKWLIIGCQTQNIDVRVWDLPWETDDTDVKDLFTNVEGPHCRYVAELEVWRARWENGSLDGHDAYAIGLIAVTEILFFNYKEDEEFRKAIDVMCLRNLAERRKVSRRNAWKRLIETLTPRPAISRTSLPNCTVSFPGLPMLSRCRQHFESNDRMSLHIPEVSDNASSSSSSSNSSSDSDRDA